MAGTATRRIAAALAVFFVIFLAYSNVNAEGQIPLFTSAAQYDVSADGRQRMADQGPEVMRSRLVTLNTALVTDQTIPAGDESILLNLFGDTNLVTVKDRLEVRPDGQYVWIGHVKDADHSSVIIVVKGTSMFANITLNGQIFNVSEAEGVIHAIREVDQSKLGQEQDPKQAPTGPGSQFDLPVMQPDGANNNIDVLVVYTPAAMLEAGSMTSMELQITAAETATNQAFGNSGIGGLGITVVGKFMVSYTESGDLGTDLNRLTNTDGYIDGVHDLRDQYAADCVVLIVGGSSSTAGIAWLLESQGAGFQSLAFCVVRRSASVDNLTFPHELGHNWGLRHDCYVDGALTPDELGHGYVDTVNAFRTIMAYNDLCALVPVNCTRIRYFSNLTQTYSGQATGVDNGVGNCGSNNAARLTSTISGGIVPNFRQSSTRTTDADGDGVSSGIDINDGNAQIASPAATTGTGTITINSTGAGNLSFVTATSDYSATYNQSTKPTDMVFPHGLVSFRVSVGAGSTVQVTLTFPSAIPAGAKYYKVDGSGNFYEYTNVTFGTNTATLTLTDNGDGDRDATPATILDPGGLAVPGTPIGGSGGGGGGGGCFIRSSTGR